MQSTALPFGTGCYEKASQGHLHKEIQLISIENSLGLPSHQYLASFVDPSHLSHAIVITSFGPQKIKA